MRPNRDFSVILVKPVSEILRSFCDPLSEIRAREAGRSAGVPIRPGSEAGARGVEAESSRRTPGPPVLRSVSNLILRVASRHQSIARARRRSKKGVSERHSQRVLKHLDRRKTQRALTSALRRQVKRFIPPGPVDIAVDLHERTYYGEAIDKNRPQYVRTKEERGTYRAYRYVTLGIVVHGFRFTVSCRYLDHRGKLVEVRQDVLADARKAGTQIERLYLDREFHTYDVLAWLQGQGLTVVLPLRLGSRQRKRWERGQKSYVVQHSIRDPRKKRGPITFRIHVVVCYQNGKNWDRRGCQYLIYAVLWHVPLGAPHAVPLERIQHPYRRRFGIESSFRIAHEALPRTCARSVPWRLLYLGVSLMLQNVWYILRLQYTSEGRQGPVGMVLREEVFRFQDMLEMLSLGVGRVLGTVREIGNPKPPPLRLRRWGMALP